MWVLASKNPLAAMLLRSPPEFVVDDLLDTFKQSLSAVELHIVQQAMGYKDNDYPPHVRDSLIGIFSQYDCLELPTSDTLLSLCQKSAHYAFISKPLAAISEIGKGIPYQHWRFWDRKGAKGIHQLCMKLITSPKKALDMLREPYDISPSQHRVYNYLVQYVGTMKCEEVQRFVRFVTGSSVFIDKPIYIEFNGLSGVARRPIAHTCDCTLELPTTYSNFTEFSQEFTSLLSQNDVWVMDGL